MADSAAPCRHCRFEGFPSRIKVVCGRKFSEARATPYSYGSQVVLSQTPLSGVMQETPVAGTALPTYEIIYSDTGDDTSFDLKLAHYGYGRFYLAAADDAAYSLAVIKGLRIEATGINRSFETVDVWNTCIPAGTPLTTDTSVMTNVWSQDSDAGIIWSPGTASSDHTVITGTVQLSGDVSIVL